MIKQHQQALKEMLENGTLANMMIEETGYYLISIDEVCDLSHALLVREAKQKGFEVSEDKYYNAKEQDIFDSYYDLVTDILSI